MAKTSPMQFLRQVRAESRKISWPAKPEIIASTIGVFIMVFISALFLYGADQVLAWLVRLIMGFGV